MNRYRVTLTLLLFDIMSVLILRMRLYSRCIDIMTQARLIICPTAPYDAPEQATDIKQALIDIGLLANEFEDNSYYAGTDFITLIMFLGCSPNIQLSPGDGNAFIYIRFSDISANSQQLGHGNSVAPGCPVCKSRLKDWKKTRNWQLADSKITCQQCNTHSLAWLI